MHFQPKKGRVGGPSLTDGSVDPPEDDTEEDPELLIGGTPIKEVSSTKFLGVIIDNGLTWQPHIQMLSRKLRSAAGSIKSIRKNTILKTYELNRCILFTICKYNLC